MTNHHRLEEVIKKWMKDSTCEMTWKNIHEVVKELQSIDGASDLNFVLILVAIFCPFTWNLRWINYYNKQWNNYKTKLSIFEFLISFVFGCYSKSLNFNYSGIFLFEKKSSFACFSSLIKSILCYHSAIAGQTIEGSSHFTYFYLSF